jgi:hypothetical protein
MNRWFSRLSWPWVFVYFTIGFGLLNWVVTVLVGLRTSPLASFVGAVLFGALMTALTMWRRSKVSAAEKRAADELLVAIRSQMLPDLIDPSAWLLSLARRTGILRKSVRTLVIVAVVAAVVYPLLAIGDPHWMSWLAIAGVLVAGIIVRAIRYRNELPRIASLETLIRARYRIEDPASLSD